MPEQFTRSIEWTPAYDKRPTYGIHGLTIRFLLTGEAGVVQFLLYTNWQLPHVTQDLLRKPYEPSSGDPHWMERPHPADLGYHSLAPVYDGQPMTRQTCEYLGGLPCYCDGSALDAEPVFHRLLAEGDTGVWAALEEYYTRTFSRAAPGGFGEVLHALITKETDRESQ